MLRTAPFRYRAHEVSRIEAFSDVVFGFAISLLVVSLEAPKNYHEMVETLRGFIPFAITFFVLGIGNSSLAGTTNVTTGTIKLGGYLGSVTAIAAWYASFSAVLNSTFGRVMMPVVPLRR